MRRFLPVLLMALLALPVHGRETPCGGPFPHFVAELAHEARAQGLPPATVEAFFRGVRRDPRVLRRDRAQGFFQLRFTDFARKLISGQRLSTARRLALRHDRLFDRIEARHGIPRGIMLAIWAFETDFGAFQGDFNTRDALVTLAHDCRRPELFRPQVIAAIRLFARGDFDPATTTGAWAGEIGMLQLLPKDLLERGVDGDGDGRLRVRSSAADALMTGARLLSESGWQPGAPWLVEVRVPAGLDWFETGLDRWRPAAEWQRLGVRPRSGGKLPAPALEAALILPEGWRGPSFLAYPNFRVLLEWNRSLTYVLTTAYFATRIEGAPVFDPGAPTPPLGVAEMKALQRRLAARGHDVGAIDGILGARTRRAVQIEQRRLGLPADGWPTRALLARLGAR